MIVSFADRETELLFLTGKSRRHAAIARVAMRKLIQMNHARTIGDLSVPPGNRLERLAGQFNGAFSIRINDQWRILFDWTPEGPARVQILDYH